MSLTSPLIVFCHLRWDFVFQRPQHLMTRRARTRPVFFVEEPVPTSGLPHWEVRSAAPGLTVWQPHTPVVGCGFGDDQYPHLQPLVRELTERAGGRYDLWFYTPMALPLADELNPRAVVYD